MDGRISVFYYSFGSIARFYALLSSLLFSPCYFYSTRTGAVRLAGWLLHSLVYMVWSGLVGAKGQS